MNKYTCGIWHADEPYFAFFRRVFHVETLHRRYFAVVTARSPEKTRQFVYNLYVNGTGIGVGPCRYGRTPDAGPDNNILYYQIYDVTACIKKGANCVGALCHTGDEKEFMCVIAGAKGNDISREIEVLFSGTGVRSGRPAEAPSGLDLIAYTGDGQWRALNGDGVFRPSNSVGTHYYAAYASNIEAVLYPYGFSEPGFEEARGGDWNGAKIKEDVFRDMLSEKADIPPVRRFAAGGAALKVGRTAEGYVIDLGREIVGGIGITFGRYPREQFPSGNIRVCFGEELLPDGRVKYRMNTGNVYEEHWHVDPDHLTVATPDMFTYRYAELFFEDALTVPEIVSVRGLSLRAPLDDGDSFLDTDNELLAEMYELTKYTVKTTTQDIYVDSQSRERGAYEGDILINQLASYCFFGEYRPARFSAEYIYTHRTWPAEYNLLTASIAYNDFMITGDISSCRKYWPVLRANTYEEFIGKYGLIHSGNPGQNGTDAVLTDWPPSERDGYDVGVKYSTVLNCLAVRTWRELSELAGRLGEREDAERLGRMSRELAAAVKKHLYNREKGTFCDGMNEDGSVSEHCSQHAAAYALYGGVCGDDAEMLGRTADHIAAAGKIRMSVYGAFFLLTGLYESGFGELANKLLLDPACAEGERTWAYMIRTLGATLTAEAWNARNKPNMTFSHPWGCAPAAAIVRGVFGIKPLEPGFSKFSVNICRAGIGRASIKVPTPHGPLFVSFDGDKTEIMAPKGTEAVVQA